ncbi:MAG: 4-(cytidine 5'-diphospho)-2-C-methyl-D-erythritol kinase [bacterium]
MAAVRANLTTQDSTSYPPLQFLPGEEGFALESPAKINLGLRILARRPDGYHDIETVFQEISLADRLEFRPADEWRLSCTDKALDCGEDNLIARAATKLSQAMGHPRKAAVHLTKRIPIGGGLGGGSSNGAVTLWGLRRLWNLNIEVSVLEQVASEMGADCPFFLRGGLAWATGRGDLLEWLEGAIGGTVVLVIPQIAVSTKWAYENAQVALTNREKKCILRGYIFQPDPLPALQALAANDFEPAVFRRFPELREIKQQLLGEGAQFAALSGSGGTLFGVFRQRSDADRAAAFFQRRYPTLICSPIARARLPHG